MCIVLVLLYLFFCFLNVSRNTLFLHVRMLRKYQDDPTIMQRVSKHFYSEEVYDDSSDRARLRWRFRNFFGENAAFSLVTDDHASNSEKSDQSTTGLKKSSPEPKQAQVSLIVLFILANLRVEILQGKYSRAQKTPKTFLYLGHLEVDKELSAWYHNFKIK